MPFKAAYELDTGDRVYWNDPDEGLCSRWFDIAKIEYCGDMARITDIDGSEVQCFLSELSTCQPE